MNFVYDKISPMLIITDNYSYPVVNDKHHESEKRSCVFERICLMLKIIYQTIIIYHDVLPPPRKGSHAKLDYTHTNTPYPI